MTSKKKLQVFKTTARKQHARLDRLLDRRSVPPMRKVYMDAVGATGRRLGLVFHNVSGPFNIVHRRMAAAHVRQAQTSLTQQLIEEMSTMTLEAQKEALRGLTADIKLLEFNFTGASFELPLEEASRFQGLISGRRESLLRSNVESMARYGARSVTDVEDALSFSMVTGETPDQAINRVQDTLEGDWYQAERIVRTEQAHAFNLSHRDGILDTAEDMPDLMQLWSEHVSDDGDPLDDRVGLDSLAMHGQVAPAGGAFVMPPTTPDGEPIHKSLVGDSWMCPPNRCNDRAVLLPWRADWGVPGWRWDGRRRVWL